MSTKVYFSNLNYYTTETELQEFLSQYGAYVSGFILLYLTSFLS